MIYYNISYSRSLSKSYKHILKCVDSRLKDKVDVKNEFHNKYELNLDDTSRLAIIKYVGGNTEIVYDYYAEGGYTLSFNFGFIREYVMLTDTRGIKLNSSNTSYTSFYRDFIHDIMLQLINYFKIKIDVSL